MATTTDPRATGTDDALRMIPLDAIDVVEGFNPRDARDAEDFAQLVATVREYGVLQPVLVAPAEDGRFRLIAGEGRYRAAIEAGDKEIPVRVRPVDDETGGVELALIENLVRERLWRMTAEQRVAAMYAGELSLADCLAWAARYPDEPPTINGEWALVSLLDRGDAQAKAREYLAGANRAVDVPGAAWRSS
jgi:hypothetical protein